MTARYNGWFNAKLILWEALRTQTEAAEENYEQLLPLRPYEAMADNSGIYPDLDRIIKKSSVAIRLHKISKWADDCYLLIGQANFLRGEYEEALAAFQVITSKYDRGIREKQKKRSRKKIARQRKKEKEGFNLFYDPTLSFMLHKPARWEALIWIIRSYTALGKTAEAQSVYALATGDKVFPDKLKEELELAITEQYVSTKSYEKAATSLTRAIEACKKRKRKVRYTFILGQLYALANSNTEAINKFTQVLGMKPSYEMEFQAQMSIVRLSAKEKNLSSEEIIARLEAMLKNDKYEQFLDEIYFALAEVYLEMDKEAEAIDNLNLSLKHSREQSHPDQQAKAYLKLADIYYNNEDYVTSKAYHDSTLSVLTAEDPEFPRVNSRRNVLASLVEQIRIVERQDTLLWLATLTPVQLAAERQKYQDSVEAASEVELGEQPEYNPLEVITGVTSSNWPFSDPGRKASGFVAFRQVWGDRGLVNNWRRSNQSAFEPDAPEVNGDSATVATVANQSGNLFEDIPGTPEELAACNSLLVDALYRIGYIYKDDLDNLPKAAETFEELIDRFPTTKYRAEVLYNLYLAYKESNPPKSKRYRELLLKEFPESLFARAARNPDFIEESELAELELTNYYASTFEMFGKERWQSVIERKLAADSMFKENHLKPQFDMLEALAYGKLGMRDTFQLLLEDVVNNYPEDEVKQRALQILHLLEGDKYRVDPKAELPGYSYEEESKHMFVVVMHEIGPSVGQVKNSLSDYISLNHSLEGLKVTSLLLNNTSEMIVVNAFSNGIRAVTFYNEVRYNKDVFGTVEESAYTAFPISEYNYGVFFREKDIPAYIQFLTEHYLSNN